MTEPTIPLLTRFELAVKRYIITGFRVIGCFMRSPQYECRCTSGPLTTRWLPAGEVEKALDTKQTAPSP